jgi:uncharacterized protein (DUF2164 family)
MTIELSKEDRQQAVSSIERYFRENIEEKIGNVAASGLLGFILEEIGPSIYNKGVADAQERIQARATELDFEVHEEEFTYWKKYDKPSSLSGEWTEPEDASTSKQPQNRLAYPPL